MNCYLQGSSKERSKTKQNKRDKRKNTSCKFCWAEAASLVVILSLCPFIQENTNLWNKRRSDRAKKKTPKNKKTYL